MRFAIRCVIVAASASAVANSYLHAQAATVTVPITPTLIKKEFLGAFNPERDKAHWGLWLSIRSRPETVRALVSLREDSTEPPIIRDQALAMLGATGQAAGYVYLAKVLNQSKLDDYQRVVAIHGLGNGPVTQDRPEIVYQALTSMLTRGNEQQRVAATMALGKIHSQRSLQLLRDQRVRDSSPAVRSMIDQSLSNPRSP